MLIDRAIAEYGIAAQGAALVAAHPCALEAAAGSRCATGAFAASPARWAPLPAPHREPGSSSFAHGRGHANGSMISAPPAGLSFPKLSIGKEPQ
jgi:hypothetical protein